MHWMWLKATKAIMAGGNILFPYYVEREGAKKNEPFECPTCKRNKSYSKVKTKLY